MLSFPVTRCPVCLAALFLDGCAPFWLMQSNERTDEGPSEISEDPCDQDGDGFRAESCGGDDCDDAEPTRFPGAPEICGNDLVEACAGSEAEAQASCMPGGELADASAYMWEDNYSPRDSSFGSALAMAGDIDGDGVDDALIGAPDDLGVLLVLGTRQEDYGGTSAFEPDDLWLADEDGSDVTSFGAAVAAGDFDGDGLSDVLVGAPVLVSSGADAVVIAGVEATQLGAAYLFLGSALADPPEASLVVSSDIEDDSFGAAVMIWRSRDVIDPIDIHVAHIEMGILVVGAPRGGEEANGSLYLQDEAGETARLDGEPGEGLGNALTTTDYTGDGLSDLVVGASGAYDGTGRVYILESAYPLDELALESAHRTFDGEHEGDQFGFALAGEGDIDGDGLGDLLVGAPGYSSADNHRAGAASTGVAYLLMGSSSNTISLNPIAILFGTSSGDLCGQSVALGDVDADGVDELMTGCPGAESSSGDETGRVELLYADTEIGIRFEQSSSSFAGIGSTLASGGDLDADGHDDLLVGVSYHDEGPSLPSAEVHLIFGAGF